MTTARSAERRLTAFLDGADNPNIPNAIHSTEGAKEYGYEAALVGGATVFGWATPAILEALGDGWTSHGWAEVAFRRPTYPGEELVVSVQPEGDAWAVRVTGSDGHDRVSGTVGLGDAAWLGDIDAPSFREADPVLEERPRLTMDVAPAGQEIRTLGGEVSAAEMREYARDRQRTEDPRFTGERPLLHPGWIAARPIRALHHSYDYGPSIHAKSLIQLVSAPHTGNLVTTAKFVEAYERKGHHYAVIDCATYDEGGRELIRQRHTNIFQVAKRGEA